MKGLIEFVPSVWSAKGEVLHGIMEEEYNRMFRSPEKSVAEIIEEASRKTGIDKHVIAKGLPIREFQHAFREFFRQMKGTVSFIEVEKEIDGANIGMSSIRADIVAGYPLTVLDLKTHIGRGKVLKQHYLQITSYALGLEAELKEPVDVGGILEVVNGRVRVLPFYISGTMRREVARLVAQKAKVCKKLNPEMPERSGEEFCNRCYFRRFCYEEHS